MSYQEKKALLSMCSSVLIIGIYTGYLWVNYREQIMASPNDFSFWGTAFLILIPVSIGANIVIHIAFAIINKIITNEDAPKITDELDKLIELKAIRTANWTFVLGFFLAMASQAMKMEPYVMFLTLIAAGFAASIAAELTKIYLYRKGV
jgi:hypothetical protein